MSNWNPYIWVTASCIDNLVILGDKTGPLSFCWSTKLGQIPIVLENMTNTVETKLSDFVCSYLWFLAISLMKEDASHQRVHTPDLQKWDGWHAEILNNLWLEKWECCVSRVVQIPRPTRCHIMVCAPISHMNWQILSSVYKYLASLGKANMKNKFQKTPLELSPLLWGVIFSFLQKRENLFCEHVVQNLVQKGWE